MFTPVDITLEYSEVLYAAQAGIYRRVNSMRRGFKDKDLDDNRDVWDIDIEGACAEMAYAKASGVYWGGHINSFKAPDVGCIQIRSTKYFDGKLIIRENDNLSQNYVLVITKCPVYSIVGYIRGSDAIADHKKTSPNGKSSAWFIPQRFLKDPRDLINGHQPTNI